MIVHSVEVKWNLCDVCNSIAIVDVDWYIMIEWDIFLLQVMWGADARYSLLTLEVIARALSLLLLNNFIINIIIVLIVELLPMSSISSYIYWHTIQYSSTNYSVPIKISSKFIPSRDHHHVSSRVTRPALFNFVKAMWKLPAGGPYVHHSLS